MKHSSKCLMEFRLCNDECMSNRYGLQKSLTKWEHNRSIVIKGLRNMCTNKKTGCTSLQKNHLHWFRFSKLFNITLCQIKLLLQSDITSIRLWLWQRLNLFSRVCFLWSAVKPQTCLLEVAYGLSVMVFYPCRIFKRKTYSTQIEKSIDFTSMDKWVALL